MDLIYENYSKFLEENESIFGNPNNIYKLQVDEGLFEAYIDSLVSSIDTRSQVICRNICRRQRESLLESMQSQTTNFANGFNVMSYAMVVDIYREPILSEIMNVYPIDKPSMSIPRMKVKSQTRSYDGTTVEESFIPTASKRVGAGFITIQVAPNSLTNIFTTKMISPEKMKMNRRYTSLTSINITEKDSGGNPIATFIVDGNFIPDSRHQIATEFVFEDAAAETVQGIINGNVNFDKGIIQYNVSFIDGTPGHKYECNFCEFSLRFVPVATMNGRTNVILQNEIIDVTIDPNEDFVISVTEEELQDWSSIFKIDVVRTISDVIKRQILLNKDFELSYLLKSSENDMRKYGAALTLDLNKYRDMNNNISPNSIMDIFKSLIPAISTLYSIIRRNYGMEPSYLLAGLKTASTLRSLQGLLSVNLPDLRGDIGFSGSGASQFMKMKILECYSLEESKIYMVTKPSDSSLQHSSLVDIVFQPLYMVKEITDGNTKQFIRSRTAIQPIRTDGMGFINVTGLDQFLAVS